jgi:peroxiredoxin
MNLQQKLDTQKKKTETSAPKEALEVMHRATEDLAKSGIMDRIVKKGDRAPDFTLNDINGNTVNLKERLLKCPVVLGFYRGRWWPYCNLELEALEQAYTEIKSLGASFLMISPQTEEHSRAFVKNKKLSMEILSDPGNQTAEKYGLVYTVPADLKKVYLQFGIDLTKYNDDDTWRLPMSARYIIDQDQVIRYAEVSPDYTVRPDPSHTIDVLKEMTEWRGV